MSRLVAAVQAAALQAVTQGSAGWMLATVTATYTDGTVDISTALGAVAKVRRMKHYTPAVSDRVRVDYNADGNWIVVGALATS